MYGKLALDMTTCPASVLIAAHNEERNLPACLEPLAGWADEIVVVDSHSSDRTVEIARSYGARVVQFDYTGGWPKKRQWALDTHAWRNDWILLLDADEILTSEARDEIAAAIYSGDLDGYYLSLRIVFLGRLLRFGDTRLWKLALFRRGAGRYEKRLEDQDASMLDMEIHEHVVVDGKVGRIHAPVRHENLNDLSRYIEKHNGYSNWEARVWLEGGGGELRPRLGGTQAERRRWLKKTFLHWPGSPLIFFVWRYVFRLGFLDGVAGLIHASFKAIQVFTVKAKIYEAKQRAREPPR